MSAIIPHIFLTILLYFFIIINIPIIIIIIFIVTILMFLYFQSILRKILLRRQIAITMLMMTKKRLINFIIIQFLPLSLNFQRITKIYRKYTQYSHQQKRQININIKSNKSYKRQYKGSQPTKRGTKPYCLASKLSYKQLRIINIYQNKT